MPDLARVSSPPVSEPVVIELRGVRAGYDGRTVIDNVDLTVRRGEFVALVGANGAGKSTLLKVIVGLLRPYEGSVSVLGSAPGTSARRLAYLPQAETVHWDYPLRVEDVVLMGRVAHAVPGRGPSSVDRDAARSALGPLGTAVPEIGEFDLAELRALVGRAAVYIGGDSGPLHIAGTTTTPIVALLGPTLAERSMPWRDPRWFAEAVDAGPLECRPCRQRECAPGDFRCLTHITAEQVAASAERTSIASSSASCRCASTLASL